MAGESIPHHELNYKLGPNAIDVSKERDGKLFKEIIKEAEAGSCHPDSGVEVFVNYIGTLPDGTEFDRSNLEKPFNFVLGKASVIKGWEQGVASMKKGEKCRLICHPDYGYGATDNGKIPANSTLIFEIDLLYWKDEDLTYRKTGGITRRNSIEGTSKYLSPNEGSKITVKIEGKDTVEGIVFDDREVTFPLGEGSAYDIPYGLEKALYFTENLTSKKTGGITRIKLIEYTSKYLSPNEGAKITVKIEGKDTVEGIVFDDREVTFPLGEGSAYDIPYGLEKALYKFTEKEKSIIFLQPKYGFGEKGNTKLGVGANRELQYSVELKDFEKAKENWQLEGKEKLEMSVKHYKRLIDFLKTEAFLTLEEEMNRKNLLAGGYLNQAMCYIKLKDHVQALRCCDEALMLNPRNVKGFYLTGLSNLGLNKPKEARCDFLIVTKLDPVFLYKEAVQQIAICDKLMKEHQEKEKQIYGKMSDKLVKIDKAKDIAALKKQPNGLDDLDEWEKSESNVANTNGSSTEDT